MTQVFKEYTKTVQKLLLRYNPEISKAFIEKHLEEIFNNHDIWDDGIDYYDIRLQVPTNTFLDLKDSGKLEETEKKVKDCYADILKGCSYLAVNAVHIFPGDDEGMENNDRQDDNMWKPGCFRLFISNVSKYNETAQHLKNVLLFYGIDCFVAHEDIEPSNEWESTIESALFSMDALCAIVVPEFKKSDWCSQEVGIGWGQHKMVFSINKGAIPYGFFAKYQALSSIGKNVGQVAKDVWSLIIKSDRTKDIYAEKLVSLLLNVKTKEQAIKYLNCLKEFQNITLQYVDMLHEHYRENQVLMDKPCLTIANEVFKHFGYDKITVNYFGPTSVLLSEDLPF